MTDILTTVKSVRAYHHAIKPKKWALVPTMGNLHDGHLSLLNIAKANADVVIASIFVNPTQFGVGEDLAAYPRTFEDDLKKLQDLGIDAVFYPEISAMYPYGAENTISLNIPPQMTTILCGVQRPTHFQGVATVVAKLFQIVHPDIAVFGEKDFQQLAIIRRLNKELYMNIKILGGDIIREDSGLALSSRNQYLNTKERSRAAGLSKTLRDCRERLLQGQAPAQVLTHGKMALSAQQIDVEYLEFRDIDTLAEQPEFNRGILLIAAKLGKTRLIDNLRIA